MNQEGQELKALLATGGVQDQPRPHAAPFQNKRKSEKQNPTEPFVAARAFDPSTFRGRCWCAAVNLRLAWAVLRVWGQLELHRVTLSQNRHQTRTMSFILYSIFFFPFFNYKILNLVWSNHCRILLGYTSSQYVYLHGHYTPSRKKTWARIKCNCPREVELHTSLVQMQTKYGHSRNMLTVRLHSDSSPWHTFSCLLILLLVLFS